MKSIIKFTAVLSASAALVTALGAVKEPLDTIDRQPVPKWQWKVTNNGQLELKLPGNSYTLSTRMSYPNMAENAWNVIPGKRARVSRSGKKVIVDFACDYYELHRVIEEKGHRLLVRDTFKNTTGQDLAIAFDNTLKPGRNSGEGHILLAGCLAPGSAPTPDSPAQNSSIFFNYPDGSIAMVLEDDFYRLQASLMKKAGCGTAENRSFALAPKKSYTFEYSFYPTGKGDYWDFINRLRDDWKVNSKIDGNLIFGTCPHPQVASYMPPVLKTALKDYLGAKYICGTNYTWYGCPAFFIVPGSKRFMKEYGSREKQLEKLKRAVKNAASISPDISVVAKIQTVFAAPPQLPNEPVPYADSVIIEANGKPKFRQSKSKDGKVVGYVNLHYPMVGNSYHKFLTDLVNRAMDAGIKTIYFDTFCYSFWTLYGRWTYDRWDGHTVDINPKTWTILRKKADLAVLSSDAIVDFYKIITKRGGKMFFNGTPSTRKQMSIIPGTNSFTESAYAQLPITQHVSHPVNLGYSPGYKHRGEAWKTPKDMYENVMDNLEYGCLTYIYWMVGKLPTAPTIYQRMFPVTVKKIYAGCVIGEERIITKRSGKYSFGNMTAPRIYLYDKDGMESAPTAEQAKCQIVNGKMEVTLTLPPGGAAVLEKQSSVKDSLAGELDF